MMRVSCSIFVLFALFIEAYPYPTAVPGVKQCFKHTCPSNTYACEKRAKISEDKKYIVSEVKCLGSRDMVLKTFREQQDNIFSPGTDFQSYSYAGSWTLTADDSDEDFPKAGSNYGGTLGVTEGRDTEIVDTNLIDSDKHFRASTASEIDDLNS
ncbi:unnamed protein product [Acanthoscelides obtectus]|uniref:Uncharacterized protein n=1 Tax=Acanthoscelides obtectus TaxID=200917 RepID=A0A9P0NXP5_ACAOB|nr:unnamed protein product [Acanthoscelides obtectus]CAK1667964.1 hypothetical protein AOBTE_LOCUS26142 [Acanthoscelides obtectus]